MYGFQTAFGSIANAGQSAADMLGDAAEEAADEGREHVFSPEVITGTPAQSDASRVVKLLSAAKKIPGWGWFLAGAALAGTVAVFTGKKGGK